MAQLVEVPIDCYVIISRFLTLVEIDCLLLTCKTILKKLVNKGVTHIRVTSRLPTGIFASLPKFSKVAPHRLLSLYKGLESLSMEDQIIMPSKNIRYWALQSTSLKILKLQIGPTLSSFISTLSKYNIVLNRFLPLLTTLDVHAERKERPWQFGLNYLLASLPRSLLKLRITSGTDRAAETLDIQSLSSELPPKLKSMNMPILFNLGAETKSASDIANSLRSRNLMDNYLSLRTKESQARPILCLPSTLRKVVIIPNPGNNNQLMEHFKPRIYDWTSITFEADDAFQIPAEQIPSNVLSLQLGPKGILMAPNPHMYRLEYLSIAHVVSGDLNSLKTLILTSQGSFHATDLECLPSLRNLIMPDWKLLVTDFSEGITWIDVRTVEIGTKFPSSLTRLSIRRISQISVKFIESLPENCLVELILGHIESVEAGVTFSRFDSLQTLELVCNQKQISINANNQLPDELWLDSLVRTLPKTLRKLRLDARQKPQNMVSLPFSFALDTLELPTFSVPLTSMLKLPTTLTRVSVASISISSDMEMFLLKDFVQKFSSTIFIGSNNSSLDSKDEEPVTLIVPPNVLRSSDQSYFDEEYYFKSPIDLHFGDSDARDCTMDNIPTDEDDAHIRTILNNIEAYEAVNNILCHFKLSSCVCKGKDRDKANADHGAQAGFLVHISNQ